MGILICMENFFKYICEPQVCNEDKLAPKDWCRLYSLAHSQGVGSIVWSNIGNKSLLPKALKIQWALEAEYVKINYNNQTFEDVYSEEVLPDKEPTIYLGQRIKILWYECDHTYLQIAETREEKRQLARRVFLETLSLELRTFARKRWLM